MPNSKVLYQTQYTYRSTSELKKLVAQHNREALEEILIRSIDSMVNSGRSEAIAACDEQLKLRPTDNFFNFIRGCHEQDTAKKIHYLEMAAMHTEPRGTIISAQAALELAYYNKSSPYRIASHVWALRALLLGSKEAEFAIFGTQESHKYVGATLTRADEKFDKNYPISVPLANEKSYTPMYALQLAFYLAALLGGYKRTESIAETHWYKRFSNQFELLTVPWGVSLEEVLKGVAQKANPFHLLLSAAIRACPEVFLEFFQALLNKKILPPQVCQIVFELFMREDFSALIEQGKPLLDRVTYLLSLLQLKQKNLPRANSYLLEISPSFEGWRVSDFNHLPATERDTISYFIFKLLMAQQRPEQALLFLNNILDPSILDQAVFQYFDLVDPQLKNPDTQQFKRALLEKICEKLVKDEASPFHQRIALEIKLLDSKCMEIRLALTKHANTLIEYVDIREQQRKKLHPIKIWKGDEVRNNMRSRLDTLLESEGLRTNKGLSKLTALSLVESFMHVIEECKKTVTGPESSPLLQNAYDQIGKLRKQINLIKAEELDVDCGMYESVHQQWLTFKSTPAMLESELAAATTTTTTTTTIVTPVVPLYDLSMLVPEEPKLYLVPIDSLPPTYTDSMAQVFTTQQEQNQHQAVLQQYYQTWLQQQTVSLPLQGQFPPTFATEFDVSPAAQAVSPETSMVTYPGMQHVTTYQSAFQPVPSPLEDLAKYFKFENTQVQKDAAVNNNALTAMPVPPAPAPALVPATTQRAAVSIAPHSTLMAQLSRLHPPATALSEEKPTSQVLN